MVLAISAWTPSIWRVDPILEPIPATRTVQVFVLKSKTSRFFRSPSAHGAGNGGAAEVLRRLYGEAGYSITVTNPAAPGIVLHYTSFSQITNDISDARVYGGIHFRTDQVTGAALGRAVGAAV
jgi:hypothetical protein